MTSAALFASYCAIMHSLSATIYFVCFDIRLNKFHYLATCLNPKMKTLRMLESPVERQSTYDSLRHMMAENFEEESSRTQDSASGSNGITIITFM